MKKETECEKCRSHYSGTCEFHAGIASAREQLSSAVPPGKNGSTDA